MLHPSPPASLPPVVFYALPPSSQVCHIIFPGPLPGPQQQCIPSPPDRGQKAKGQRKRRKREGEGRRSWGAGSAWRGQHQGGQWRGQQGGGLGASGQARGWAPADIDLPMVVVPEAAYADLAVEMTMVPEPVLVTELHLCAMRWPTVAEGVAHSQDYYYVVDSLQL